MLHLNNNNNASYLSRVRGDNRQDIHDLGARHVTLDEQFLKQPRVKLMPVGQLEVLHHARIDEAGARHVDAVRL